MMKTRERLKQMRASSDWLERLELAEDKMVDKDRHLHLLRRYALRALAQNRDGALRNFGKIMAEAVKRGDSGYFRRWAALIDAWSKHEPQPDKLREAIIGFCVPQDEIFTMRELMAHLEQCNLVTKRGRGKASGVDERRNEERAIRRICKELGFRIKGKPGAPRKH